MEKPLLVELKRHDQIDKILSSLQEIVDSGTSVVFSFSRQVKSRSYWRARRVGREVGH
jgi:hypothetical protein